MFAACKQQSAPPVASQAAPPAVAPAPAPTQAPTPAPAAAPKPAQDVTFQKDVVYGNADGQDLKMDLAIPPDGPDPRPALVCIHGGGWQIGQKSDYAIVINQFAKSGYVAAAVDYRLLPKYKWPSQIEDVKCATRYLRAHAKELNIDPNRIGAVGDSAGGHLALLLGLMDPADGLEGAGGNPEQSSKVQLVVNFYGPTDMRVWTAWPESEAILQHDYGTNLDGLIARFLGSDDKASAVYAQASPVTYASAGDPPVLTIHGDKDPLVPIDQAKLLQEALQKAGVQEKFITMPGAGHGFGGAQLVDALTQGIAFADSVLKTPKAAS
jgi:acetyl esterase/lipase